MSANIFLATFVLKTGSPRFQIRFAFPRISKNMQMKLFVWQKKLQLFFQYNQWRSHVVRRLLHRILLSRFLRLFSSKKLSDQNTIFNLEIMWIINHKTMTRSFDVNLYVITLLATPTAQVIFWLDLRYLVTVQHLLNKMENSVSDDLQITTIWCQTDNSRLKNSPKSGSRKSKNSKKTQNDVKN